LVGEPTAKPDQYKFVELLTLHPSFEATTYTDKNIKGFGYEI